MFFKRRGKTEKGALALMQQGETVYQIPFLGRSMDPLFSGTEFVWVDFSQTQDLSIGDVIVYKSEGDEFVCHRLIGMQDRNYFLKGDNSLFEEKVNSQNHLGRVVAIEKNGQRHPLRNTFLLRLYCRIQMSICTIPQIWMRRALRKIGFAYLSFVNLFLS